MIFTNNKKINKITWGKKRVEAVYKGSDLVWPQVYLQDKYVGMVFNQNADPKNAFSTTLDNGFIPYVTERVNTYLGKCMEDGTVTVIPVKTVKDLEHGSVNLYTETAQYELYYDIPGTPKSIYSSNSTIDILVQVPTIYYSCKEIEEDVFDLKISTYPFYGCHELFGKDHLIGCYSGERVGDKYYSDVNVSPRSTFTQIRQSVENKGPGWYGMYTEQAGLLMMIDMCLNGVNGSAVTYNYNPWGIHNVFTNGGDGRNYFPNLVIDPETNVATVKHLDGKVEHFDVPYIWSEYFDKLYWGEYLTMLPKSKGPKNRFYNESQTWIGNSKGIGIYTSCENGKWQIAGDRDDSDATGIQLRCRPCYYGKYHITHDADYFESLPIL